MESVISLIVGIFWVTFIVKFFKGAGWKVDKRSKVERQREIEHAFSQADKPIPASQKQQGKPISVPKKQQEKPHVHAGETTGYLHEKAMLDQREHELEERETKRRLAERSGGMIPATRLYLGDPVPNNCRCVVCSYCAAENLIPHGSNKEYCCYFCREAL